MSKKRSRIPKSVSDLVLKEFKHKCAICGRLAPHLHHIDENPENNVIENLLPLCPNCHLQDIHDPTSSPDRSKIRLFRKTKDPFILDSRFKPLWDRLKFLRNRESEKYRSWKWSCLDLSGFIKTLKMGEYYSKRILDVIKKPSDFYIVYKRIVEVEVTHEQIEKSNDLQEKVREYRASCIEELCVEMLRYQDWKPHSNDNT